MGTLAIAACQINPTVGDIQANANKIEELIDLAKANGASVVVFPELSISGYPPEDLLAKPSYLRQCQETLEKLASTVSGVSVIIGAVEFHGDLYNTAAILDEGKIVKYVRKEVLPNYLVFDEKRYFKAGTGISPIFSKNGIRFAVTVCEDAWIENGPIAKAARNGAEAVININASPYSIGKRQARAEMLRSRSLENNIPIVYLNQVGGQDELVFDGASMVFDKAGDLTLIAESFIEEVLYVELTLDDTGEFESGDIQVIDLSPTPQATFKTRIERLDDFALWGSPIEPIDPDQAARDFSPSTWEKRPFRAMSELVEPSMVKETYQALVLGTRDYVRKNGFSDVVLGLSGGIDSALVATIVTDALGGDRVHCVAMPSRYSSEGSVTDAKALALNLDADFIQISIEPAHRAYLEMSHDMLGGAFEGLPEENLQSRLRGVLLMALSNQRNWLVVTTGNKSELATGYSTLYGDTAGGFGVIKDLSKTMVYRLARFRNEEGIVPLIPQAILTKAPSAELRPDQRDDQSLPPYEILDPIVESLVELDYDVADLVRAGFDAETVARVARLIDLSEYKRRQNPPGVRVTERAFGKDRRVPITNGFKPWKMENQ